MQKEVLDKFLFVNDMAIGAPTEEKMQKYVDQVSDSCDSYDITTGIKTTEVVYQPAPGNPFKEPVITVKGQRLQVVDKFTYLGSTLSRVVHKSMPGLPKLVQHLPCYVEVFGIDMESDLT